MKQKLKLNTLKKNIQNYIKNFLFAMLPSDPEVGRNTIIEIGAGAGGGEASLFRS